ncbi:MAG: hypothetical protein AAGC46_21055, partial [Solirubrobacteraceae bacterium]
MSLFGGGRRGPRERTEEERRQALIERERRRTGNANWQPPAGHPLAYDGSGAAPQQPAAPAEPTYAQPDPQRAQPQQPAAPVQQAQPTAPRQPAAAPRAAAPQQPAPT